MAASAAKTNTIAVVIPVSLREGQVTLLVSCRTSCANLNGLNFAISLSLCCLRLPVSFQIGSRRPSLKDEQTNPVWGYVPRGRRSPGRLAMGRFVMRGRGGVKHGESWLPDQGVASHWRPIPVERKRPGQGIGTGKFLIALEIGRAHV